MSSQENEARKQLRTGIRGEYEMRPLYEFKVTTQPAEMYGWKRIESPLGVCYMKDGFSINPVQYKNLITKIQEMAQQLRQDTIEAQVVTFRGVPTTFIDAQTAILDPIVVACWEASEQLLLDMQRDWTGSMLAQFLGVLGTIPQLPETGCPPEFIHVLYWQKAMEELFLLKQTPS